MQSSFSMPAIPEVRIASADDTPIRSLRKRLTLSFVWVSLAIYLFVCCLAIVILSSMQDAALEANLKRLILEIQPSVRVVDGQLTLRDWAANARKHDVHIYHVVELFNRQGKLNEEYGPPGTPFLIDGRTQHAGLKIRHRFQSKYVPLWNAGYLQVQVDAKAMDDAFFRFAVAVAAMIPVVAVTAGVAGYKFCGKAVEPVSETLQLLRRFVDDAGHELRTPVAIISASVETIEQSVSQDAPIAKDLEKVIRANQRLKNLSSNLLDLAKLESPAFRMQYQPLELNELVNNAAEDFQGPANEKNILLVTNVVADTITVNGNADALHRMLCNLLDNAIRYTPAGEKVSISCVAQHANAVITVEDSGIGIPQESLKHVFERFFRVETARSRQHGGTGLGLSIVKSIVDAHSGTITVASKLEQGTKFTVTLPIARNKP